jgi:hypothetical protein
MDKINQSVAQKAAADAMADATRIARSRDKSYAKLPHDLRELIQSDLRLVYLTGRLDGMTLAYTKFHERKP